MLKAVTRLCTLKWGKLCLRFIAAQSSCMVMCFGMVKAVFVLERLKQREGAQALTLGLT